MAGIAKPNVEGLRGTAQYAVIGVLGGQGSGGTISNTGLLNGVQVNEWNTANVMYWDSSGTYIELDISTSKVNIWRSGTTSWKTYTAPLKIEKWNGTSYDDVTTLYPQTVTAITETQWEKTISNLPKGRYKFSYNGSVRLDSEWYIENININKILILDNGVYKRWNTATSELEIVTSSTPTEQDFINNGNEKSDLESIPDIVWRSLAKHDVKIIEYTDNVSQTESVLTIETEPFSFYDEMGDSIDILYYTDNQEITSPNLEIAHNYSPLDDLDGDFDIVTYTDNDEIDNIELSVSALPLGQIVVENDDIELYGSLKELILNKVDEDTPEFIRLCISTDEGSSWKSYKGGSWYDIDITSKDSIILNGMRISELNTIPSKDLDNFKNIRLCYYIDEENDEFKSSIKSVTTNQTVNSSSPIINDGAFYILNTVSTINLSLVGSTVTGNVDDIDKGKVRYKIILNNNQIYPNSGYTEFANTPLDIKARIDNSMINMGSQNTLRVEVQDYWGATDYWETTFIGTYSGLLFKSPNEEYYSDEVGHILKYLDMGTIIAGQITQDFEVKLVNTNGFDVENVVITPSTEAELVSIELSKTTNPFVAEETLSFEQLLDGEEVSFYVRILTSYSTPPVSGGLFELRVDADEITS